MLAPCITVLSTSKKAAAVGIGGVAQRQLDLGVGGGRLPGQSGPLLEVQRAARTVRGSALTAGKRSRRLRALAL